MEDKVLKAIDKFDLINGGIKTVTVAVSGGADSMALLYVLNSLKSKLGITLNAAHFNHKIRGDEADRDEQFVKNACEKLGIELFCESGDVPGYAKDNSLSIELAARELRYDFLSRMATGLVATAHTASDNLETVLFNLTRGTASEGLCGIPAKRDNFIRPLILCTREDVENYCNSNNIEYVTDSTNLCDDYTRNKIRHNVVPVLREINPSAEVAVRRMSEHLRADSEALESIAFSEYMSRINPDGSLSTDGFGQLPKAIALRVIKRFYTEKTDCQVESIHIENICEVALKKGSAVGLPDGLRAQNRKNALSISRPDDKKNECFEIEISKQDNTFFDKNGKIHNLLLKNVIDCDKIVGSLKQRTRQPADSVRLLGRKCTKPLGKLFCEEAVNVDVRDRLPILSDDEGVVWVFGFGVAQRCAATKNSKKVLVIKQQQGEL